MTLQTKMNVARVYGSIAYAKGERAIPATCPECMALLEGMPIGGDGLKVMSAWVAGWTEANLAA